MSPSTSRRLYRVPRHTCRTCHEHPAKFRFRGQVRADRDHELCFQCFRAEVNRQREAVDGRVNVRPAEAGRYERGMADSNHGQEQ